MKEKSTKEKTKGRTNWNYLHKMKDKDIDYRDNPPTNAKFWEGAEMQHPKTHLSIRLDSSIVSYFKEAGPGYQSRINAVLRAFVRNQLSDK